MSFDLLAHFLSVSISVGQQSPSYTTTTLWGEHLVLLSELLSYFCANAGTLPPDKLSGTATHEPKTFFKTFEIQLFFVLSDQLRFRHVLLGAAKNI